MDALHLLKTRRCIRSYEATPISKEIIQDIVDCGHLAATARNEQPWEFVVVTDAATRSKLAEIATHGKFIADAPVCIAVICKECTYYLEDGSAATQNLLLGARAHNLGACWVAGDKKPYAVDVLSLLGVPSGYKLISLVPIGHPASDPKPAKRAVTEVIHWDTF